LQKSWLKEPYHSNACPIHSVYGKKDHKNTFKNQLFY
jgi:hypothetical protein